MSGVFVVLEDRDGRMGRTSWEAVAAAVALGRQTGTMANAIVLGAQTGQLASEASKRVSGKIVRVEHPLLSRYTADGFSLALEQFIRAESPGYLVFPHTYQVRDYVPALAARFARVLIGDVIGIEDGPVFTRQLM